jgi:hypothetical protein
MRATAGKAADPTLLAVGLLKLYELTSPGVIGRCN